MINIRFGLAELEKQIERKTRKEKLFAIKQAIINYNKSVNSVGDIQMSSSFEIGFDKQAEGLYNTIEKDNSIAYSYDLNWFFNADNIPAQDKVFATKDFLEQKRKGLFETRLFQFTV